MTRMQRLLTLILCVPTIMLGAQRVHAASPTQLIADSERAIDSLVTLRRDEGMADAIRSSHGVLIVPKLLRAGLVVGGSGGDGVLLARDPQSGRWSNPVFVELKGASLGLQAGAETMQAVFVIKTAAALEALLSREVKIGADVSVVSGDDDKVRAEKTRTFNSPNASEDLLAFAEGEGLYAGTSVSGPLVDLKAEWNGQVYGEDKSAQEIVRSAQPANTEAARLMDRLATL